MEQRYSIAIVGCGPAGLSAALNAKIRNKSTLLFGDNGISSKVSRAGLVKNYLGLPSVSGDELRKAFSEHIKQMGITITDTHIDGIYSMGNYFVLCSHGKMYEAKTVILAVGSKVANPLPGEKDLLGNGISYCATCDGNFYRGKKIAVYCNAAKYEHEVEFLADLAEEVFFFPAYPKAGVQRENVRVSTDYPVKIDGSLKVTTLMLRSGEELAIDGIFILRNAIAPTTLLKKLAVEDGHIVVNRRMETNLPGCFAAGDCTGRPYQYC